MTQPRQAKFWMSRALVLMLTGATGFGIGAALSGAVVGGVVLAAVVAVTALPYALMVSWKP